jgi:hypothetical protein
MSNCPHGVYLGVGCKKCPQRKKQKISKERRVIIKAALLVSQRSRKETDQEKKNVMGSDFRILVRMARGY